MKRQFIVAVISLRLLVTGLFLGEKPIEVFCKLVDYIACVFFVVEV
jgi:hypothetical protein